MTFLWRFRALARTFLDVYNWLVALAAINIIWLLCGLSIVLLPPATAALYDVAYHARRGEGPTVLNYLRAMHTWFVMSWKWGGMTAVLVVVAIVALRFYSALPGAVGQLLYLATGLILFVIILVQFYFWPYMVIQDNPGIFRAIRNATLTVLGDPLSAIFYSGLALALGFVSVLLIVPFVIITPVLIVFLGVYPLYDWLSHHHLIETVNDD